MYQTPKRAPRANRLVLISDLLLEYGHHTLRCERHAAVDEVETGEEALDHMRFRGMAELGQYIIDH